jgi:Protein of unknown function (DUF1702)
MWSGVGLAATYAGLASESVLRDLCDFAGPLWPQLAQGAAFAAKARQRAGNLTPYTELAAKVLCGLSATDAVVRILGFSELVVVVNHLLACSLQIWGLLGVIPET